MKILITGGNGYIANSINKALRNVYDITIITRQDFDLMDSKAVNTWFADKYFDVVIHTAVAGGSRLKPDTAEIVDRNLIMYYNLINNGDKFDKFIHFGSGAELLMKDTPYGLSKHIIRESLLIKENCYNIRIYGVFDENELDTRFIKANIKRYINKESMMVQDKQMSFFYMDDLVMLVKHHIDTDASKLKPECSCAYLPQTSLVDIANKINDLSDYKVSIYVDSQPSANYQSELNAPYHLEPYGLKYIGLEQGLKNTYNNLKKKINNDKSNNLLH
jgi:dTDP-4-dehydrorhamnose reductase